MQWAMHMLTILTVFLVVTACLVARTPYECRFRGGIDSAPLVVSCDILQLFVYSNTLLRKSPLGTDCNGHALSNSDGRKRQKFGHAGLESPSL